MDTRLQDAMQRLMGNTDYQLFIAYIGERKISYLESLAVCEANVVEVAKLQGIVRAFNEVLRVPEDAADEKRNR